MKGTSQWYQSANTTLNELASITGGGLPNNRLVSGRVDSDNQPIFLVPNGAAASVKLDGTPTNFIYFVEGATDNG